MNDITSRTKLSSILDKENKDLSQDSFGHRHFAQALEDLIEASEMPPPYSIGLLGPWGTGKSTIKEFYLNALNADGSKVDGQKRSDRVHCITFNAWRYGSDDDLKRALLRTAFLQLGGSEEELNLELYHQVNSTASKRRPMGDWFSEVFGQIFVNSLAFIALYLMILLLSVGAVSVLGSPAGDGITLSVLLVSTAGLTGWLSKHLVSLKIQSPALFQPRTTIAFPSRTAEEYEKLLLRQIASFAAKKKSSIERLIVFVDDLDRLSATEMVRGLDAIRNFMELPLDEVGVVFVISCDEDRVAEALYSKRYRNGAEDLPGTVFTKTDARRYLDRLFQFRLEIPLFPKQDMRSFARSKVEAIDGLIEQLERQGASIDVVVDTLIHVGVQSPRNAIQLLNAFLQSWWLAVRRETDGAGSKLSGALDAGAVTKHPNMLAALTVLKVDFPDFYDCVQARPELLREFSSVLFGGSSVSSMPLAAQDVMLGFFQSIDGKVTNTIKREHGPLRQYLAGIDGLAKPKRLQPLLRLAVDPISRGFGDGAQDVYDAMVSGDTAGVLEHLGRSLDTSPLTGADATLLEDIAEVVMQDSLQKRVNTARVLAGLSDRIAESDRPRLLRPLVRQMVSEKKVREQVGPKRAQDIVSGATERDKKDVAGAFIDDILHGGEIVWLKPSGGTPNLNEIVDLVKDAISFGVFVWAHHDLPLKQKSKLRNFMVTRSISTSEQTTSLSFGFLDSLVRSQPETLLPDVNPEYAEQAIELLSTGAVKLSSVHETLKFLGEEFDRLASSGEEDRAILWRFLTDLLGVQDPNGVELAWTSGGVHKDLASDDQARVYLDAFANRLVLDSQNSPDWSVNWPEAGTRFFDLLNNWREVLDESDLEPIKMIAEFWAVSEGHELLAQKCLEVIRLQSNVVWNTSFAWLVSNELQDIPRKTATYIGKSIGYASEENLDLLVDRLDGVTSDDEPSVSVAQWYSAIIRSVPTQCWELKRVGFHLDKAMDRIKHTHSNASYIEQILPSVIAVLTKSEQGKASDMISLLLENSAGNPDAYIAVHNAFTDKWPKLNEQIGDYQPDKITTRAVQFILENSTHTNIGVVFKSIASMIKKSLLSDTIYNDISRVMPVIWQQAPEVLKDCKSALEEILAPSDVTQILTGPQPEGADIDLLQEVLSAVSNSYDKGLMRETFQSILDEQPVEVYDLPDGALRIWSELVGSEKANSAFSALLSSSDMNDAQTLRIIMIPSPQFWLGENLALLEILLRGHERPRSQKHMLSTLSNLVATLESENEKASLVSVLIAALPKIAPEEVTEVSQHIISLDGRQSLERSEGIGSLDTERLLALQKVIPSSSLIKTLLKRQSEKANATED